MNSKIQTKIIINLYDFIFPMTLLPMLTISSTFLKFLDHTRRCSTASRTHLEKLSSRCQTSAWQNTTHTTNIHAPGGIQTQSLSKRGAADPRLSPRGHRDRRLLFISLKWETLEITAKF